MTEKAVLRDVLEEYANAANGVGDEKTLRQMTEKYPQFREDLYDFAGLTAIERHAPEVSMSEAEYEKFEKRGLENLNNFLNRKNAETLKSLTTAAKILGMKKSVFAETLGMSLSLMNYFEKRRLEFATIPQHIIKKIAETLKTTENAIAEYLQIAPDFMGQADYKSADRPDEINRQKSFDEAVEEDSNLTTEQKRKLIEM